MLAETFDIMGTMQSTGTQKSSQSSVNKGLVGASIGVAVLVLLFVFAVFQAAHEESVLGWILAAIILGWLALAVYLSLEVRKTLKASQLSFKQEAAARAEQADSMLADKLEHSFQIVLVQAKVIKEQLEAAGEDSQGMIERALDTINTTAANGKGMVKEEMKGGR